MATTTAAIAARVAAIAGLLAARSLAARGLAAAGFATAVVAELAEPAMAAAGIAAIVAGIAGVASIASIAARAGVAAAARIPVEQTAHLVPHPVKAGLFAAAIAAGITPATTGAAGRRGRSHRCNVVRRCRIGAREPGRRYQKERSIHEVSSH